MEWEAPALVLSARLHGEADMVVRLLGEEVGLTAGLARGGASRRQIALWQPGNVVIARWRARLSDQLGTVSAEPLQESAARLLDSPLSLSLLAAIMAVADGALPEREPYPQLFSDLIRLVTAVSVLPSDPPLAMMVRWELSLLSALGYGLRLDCCAVTSECVDLAYVSPRSGHAVSRAGAGKWADRLLPLPRFLLSEDDPGDPLSWLAALKMTGYFLGRHVFGAMHRPLPEAREALLHRLDALANHCQPGGRT